jgi:hypothetical protein
MALFGPANISCLLARRIVSGATGTHKATRWAIKVSPDCQERVSFPPQTYMQMRDSNLPRLHPNQVFGACGNQPPLAALISHEGQCPQVFETLKALHCPL